MPVRRKQLDLASLEASPHPAVTPNTGRFYAEAAAVLFEHNKHRSGVTIRIASHTSQSYEVTWSELHPRANNSHNDLPAAAEHGAYAIAFLLVEQLTELRVVNKSRKGTGFDYWLGTSDAGLFQDKAKIEVSGIVNGVDDVPARVKAKSKQIGRSNNHLPAFVAVIEFGEPCGVFKQP